MKNEYEIRRAILKILARLYCPLDLKALLCFDEIIMVQDDNKVSEQWAVETQRGKKVPICLKRIVLHNPSAQSYCVMVWDGHTLKLVSWNNAGDNYGNDEWSLK